MLRLSAAETAHLLTQAGLDPDTVGLLSQAEQQKRPRKYRNVRCDQPLPGKPWSGWPECGKHPSHKQHQRYEQLVLLERSGRIRGLREEVVFDLLPAVHLAGELRKKAAWRYYADAVYEELQPGSGPANWRLVVEDTKSVITRRTANYRAKKHAMKALLNLDIREV